MEPGGVNHLPEPVSPRNRSRVHKVEPTNRSQHVNYEPEQHTPFVIRAPHSGRRQRQVECRKPRQYMGFQVVAGAGFEPATFGL